MKRKAFFTCIFVMSVFFSAVAQEQDLNVSDSIVKHKVMMGETVMLIAKKYRITPKDIYELNPTAVDGISYNMMLDIPADRDKAKSKPKKQNSDSFAFNSRKQ